MRKRRIGQSDLYVSEVGLGCMSLGTDRNAAKMTIDAALAGGINYLDTADLYDQGMNEEIVGEVIKAKRKELIIATKAGNRFERGKEGWSWDPSKKHIQAAVKDSLHRLQTDYIDLYQLHGGTIEDNIDETIEAFEELKQEGIIRYYGLSSIRPNVIREYVRRSSIISVMMQYSLLDRRPEELFSFLAQHRVSVVARGPLAKGLLTERRLDQASAAIQANGYLDYSFNELTRFRSEFEQALAKQRSIQAAALHYCLSSPVVASVVAGASRSQQMKETIEAVNQEPLSTEEKAWLERISKSSQYKQHRT